MKKRLLLWPLILVPVILFLGIALVLTTATYQPTPEALKSLEQTGKVGVRSVPVESLFDYHYYAFIPKKNKRHKGFILYPGAFVDPRSYAPAARAIAEQGYTAVIVEMPFDLALFGWKRAQHIMETFPRIDTWILGGHSMGGGTACKFFYTYPRTVAGVVLWASRFPRQYRRDDTDLKVLAVYGTSDGLLTREIIDKARDQLPPGTAWLEIKGGNHTQFGWYADGLQRFDNPAEISLREQQDIIVRATVGFLNKIQ